LFIFQPCLSFEIDLTPSSFNSTDGASTTSTTTTAASNIHGRQCVHDVPVTVLPRRLWSEYGEPVMMKPDIRYQIGNKCPEVAQLREKGAVPEYFNPLERVYLYQPKFPPILCTVHSM
jgi:hypothetical protein